MPTENTPSTTASQAARRSGRAFIVALILTVVATAAVYLFLPRSSVNFLGTCFVIGLTALIIGVSMRSWRWRRHSGAVLLNLGHAESSSTPAIALGIVLGMILLFQFLIQDQRGFYTLAGAIYWFSLAALSYFAQQQPTLITTKGWYKFDTQVSWNDIAAYDWKPPQQGFTMLVLEYKHRKFLDYAAHFRIPAAQKAAVEEFLEQHIAQQATSASA